MRIGVTVHLNPTDRKSLQAIVDNRNSPQKHVWRAQIILATAEGLGTVEIMRTCPPRHWLADSAGLRAIRIGGSDADGVTAQPAWARRNRSRIVAKYGGHSCIG